MALIDSILCNYKFDANANDDANSYNGTVNSATWGAGYGKITGGYYFAGSQDIDISADSEFSPFYNDMSFSAWIKIDNTSTRHGIFGKGAASNYEYLLEINASKVRMLGWKLSGKESCNFSGSTTITTAWTHVVVTIDNSSDSNNVKIYVNGSFDTTGSMAISQMGDGTDKMHIGNGLGVYMVGYIDEPAVWNKVLTSTEITELYNSGDGLQYPFSATGWTGTIIGVTDPTHVNGIAVADIDTINGE